MDHRQSLPQLPALTALRGIAALMVCLMHFSEVFQPRVAAWLEPHTALLANGYLWVDFFFLLSGFVLTHAYAGHFADGLQRAVYGRFLWARFARIYPLHVAMLAVLVARELLAVALYLRHHGLDGWRVAAAESVGLPFSGDTSLLELLRQLLLVQSLTIDTQHVSWNFPAWSIGTEWFAYLLLPLWIALGYQRLLRAPVAAIWALLAAGVLALGWISRQTPYGLDIAGFWGLGRCVLEGVLGMATYALYQRRPPAPLQHSGFLLLMLAILGLLMHLDAPDVLAIPPIILLILGCSRSHGRVGAVLATRPLVMLGTLSYSVYLVHTPVRLVLADAWSLVTGASVEAVNLSGAITGWLLATALVVAVSWFTYHWIELPSQRWLRRRLP